MFRARRPRTTPSLRELVQQRLDDFERLGRLQGHTILGRIWLLAALRSIVEGRLVEPEIDTLKRLTAKERMWEGLSPAGPPEPVGAVIAAAVCSHRLAIVQHDDDWLTELLAGWAACPLEDVHYLLQLRVQGEIGLGLAPGGPRPYGWSEEELAELEEGDQMVGSDLADRAWRALAERDLEAARQALTEYEHILAALPEKWEAAPSKGLGHIVCFPDAVIQVERRALAALLERAQP